MATVEQITRPERILSPSDRERFLYLLNRKSGLCFQDQDIKSLETAIYERLDACDIGSIPEYYDCLTASPGNEAELRELLNLLTIKHTYFFRNRPHFKVLKNIVLPEIVREKGQSIALRPVLRIWSAGCSIGPEPYSIAMTVRDAISNHRDWDIEILATDISAEALTVAQKGIYANSVMKEVEPQFLQKYFTRTNGAGSVVQYEVKNIVKEMVQFRLMNLLDKNHPSDFDIIFCRNVMIYFATDTVREVAELFRSSLREGGYLFIGHSESLHGVSGEFSMRYSDDAVFYQKEEKNTHTPPKAADWSPKTKSVETIDPPLESLKRNDVSDKSQKSKPAEHSKELIQHVKKEIQQKNYAKALFLINQIRRADKQNSEADYLTAEIYANQGRLEDAKERLSEMLKHDDLHAPAYYLLGSIETEQNNMESAKRNFKRAIFLNDAFPMAHFGLATLHKDSGHAKEAIREYRNTLRALASVCREDISEYSGGFDPTSLKTICKNNIEQLKDVR